MNIYKNLNFCESLWKPCFYIFYYLFYFCGFNEKYFYKKRKRKSIWGHSSKFNRKIPTTFLTKQTISLCFIRMCSLNFKAKRITYAEYADFFCMHKQQFNFYVFTRGNNLMQHAWGLWYIFRKIVIVVIFCEKSVIY